MSSHFPSLHPDELVRSGLARLFSRMPSDSSKAILRDFFSGMTPTAVVDLPSHLYRLRSTLPQGMAIDIESLIDDHTLWPFFSAFQSPQKRVESREAMRHDGQPYLKLGIMATKCPYPAHIRYCATCVEIDREHACETFWHRAHQLPGIAICGIHKEALQGTQLAYRHPRNRHDFACAEALIPTSMKIGSPGSDLDQWMAKAATWILENPDFSCSHSLFRPWIIDKLAHLGYATWAGHIRVDNLRLEVLRRYPSAELQRIGCSIDSDENTWIERLLRKPRGYQHPLRYLLLLHFVDAEPRELFGNLTKTNPFGPPPWPCLNRASDHYGVDTIRVFSSRPSSNHKNLVGMFRCPICELTYTRSGPDRKPTDRMRWHHVQEYGRVWNTRLHEMWPDANYSLRQIARELGVDPRTLRIQAVRIGHSVERPGYVNAKVLSAKRNKSTSVASTKLNCTEPRRSAWLLLREKMKDRTIADLRSASPALYTWLYRHDKDWLKEHLPLPTSRQSPARHIDWHTRDYAIEQAIRSASGRLLRRTPLMRLTRTAILREAGFIWLSTEKLKRIPMTAACLDDLAESRQSYALRRIAEVKSRYRPSDTISRWRVIREAAIRPELLLDPVIITALHGSQPSVAAATVENELFKKIEFTFGEQNKGDV